MKNKILVIQHDKDDPPGSLSAWSQQREIELTIHQIYLGNPLPQPHSHSNIISLGGPMNVDQHERYPWLIQEKEFLSNCIDRSNLKILGICLGGQLLARCLGAKVFKSNYREIGWHSLKKEPSKSIAFVDWPSDSCFFQYHEDQFEIPEGATRLFTNHNCENQGFSFGNNVVGFQFHPEATIDWAKASILELPESYKKDPSVQHGKEALELCETKQPVAQNIFYSFLDRFFLV